ncbi:MAG: DEAD/DEAH box helicase [Deltaproteobacteria bacterium]|nr:DEAD/DEAH box helicase [Deltaproteobacteria bacterium]
MSSPEPPDSAFKKFGLSDPLLKALNDEGYKSPTAIQTLTIPTLLEGKDVVGQAQTGTGKTAAFALPLLSFVEADKKKPQVLVLAPTRELAIQVSDSFKRYSAHLPKIGAMPIYGGQSYAIQLRQLKRGVQVVVGTPGRVMDHMRRGTLKLDALVGLVIDEADEMLQMGFLEDVEWILQQAPKPLQIALFSATMPPAIRRIASKHLKDPEEIIIKVRTSAAESIKQYFWLARGLNKLDALCRILEAEDTDGVIVFVRTKTSTVALADGLMDRGFACAAINGDMDQKQREHAINSLKSGRLSILVATDVAARGLDVERVSHVINYDIPNDPEAYVHRIGRTGRMGRLGLAITFVAPRERHLLRNIQRITRQTVEERALPTTKEINSRRVAQFNQKITDTLTSGDLGFFKGLLEKYTQEQEANPMDVAAALAKLLQGDTPMLLKKEKMIKNREPKFRNSSKQNNRDSSKRKKPSAKKSVQKSTEEGMQRYRIEVGSNHNVMPGNIVGAIANEADLSSKFIGRIDIFDDYSTVDLPEGMPQEVLQTLKKVWVCQKQLKIRLLNDSRKQRPTESKKKTKKKKRSRK